MIRSLGLDLVEISRIQAAMQNPRFLTRILTEAEREVCRTAPKIAGRWAAKEAVSKALGTHLLWHQVEIFNDESGKPFARVEGLDDRVQKIHLSITHERVHAAAVAIVEEV